MSPIRGGRVSLSSIVRPTLTVLQEAWRSAPLCNDASGPVQCGDGCAAGYPGQTHCGLLDGAAACRRHRLTQGERLGFLGQLSGRLLRPGRAGSSGARPADELPTADRGATGGGGAVLGPQASGDAVAARERAALVSEMHDVVGAGRTQRPRRPGGGRAGRKRPLARRRGTANRTVQEALTDVIRHGNPARPVVVRVESVDDGTCLAVEIHSGHLPAAGESTGGHRLAGLRERTRPLGGDLVAGPAPGDGYLVRAAFLAPGNALMGLASR